MQTSGYQPKVLKPVIRHLLANPVWIILHWGMGGVGVYFLGAMGKTKTGIISFWQPFTCGYVRGWHGVPRLEAVSTGDKNQPIKAQCLEEISPGRTMAPSGSLKNRQTFSLHLKRRLSSSAFYCFMLANLFFQGTCCFLYWTLRVTHPCWWGTRGGKERLKSQRGREAEVFPGSSFGETFMLTSSSNNNDKPSCRELT